MKIESHAPNFLAKDEQHFRWQTWCVAGIFTLLVGATSALGARASYLASSHGTSVLFEMAHLPTIIDLQHLGWPSFGAATSSTTATTAPRDQMNILLMGVGGAGHDGPQLTDSMLIASIDLKQNRLALISIPRDLAYPLGHEQYEKINAVNAYAEADHPGEGAGITAQDLSQFFEIPIYHYVRLDFRGFAEFIDAIGGVDVNVPNSFVDTSFPTDDFGPNPNEWVTVSFTKGVQHMNADRALTYARSRHGDNGEGSDFARSRRQQLIIMAVRQKLLSIGTLSDPTKLAAIYNTVSSHIQTDLSAWDMLKLLPLAQTFSNNRVISRQLTGDPGGQLVATNINGAYMLFPKQPDWSQVRDLMQHPFNTTSTNAEVAINNDTPAPPAQHLIRVELRNGTTRTGFAAEIALKLERAGYQVSAFSNAVHRGYDQTVIYDLSDGKKSSDLTNLGHLLNATISFTQPIWTKATGAHPESRLMLNDGLTQEQIYSPNTDFLIILGDATYPLVNSLPSNTNLSP